MRLNTQLLLLCLITLGVIIISKQPGAHAAKAAPTAAFQRFCVAVTSVVPFNCADCGIIGGPQLLIINTSPCRFKTVSAQPFNCTPNCTELTYMQQDCSIAICNASHDVDSDGYGQTCCG